MEPDGRVGARFNLGAAPDPVAVARAARVVAHVDRLAEDGETENEGHGETESEDGETESEGHGETESEGDDRDGNSESSESSSIRRAAFALRRAMDAFAEAEASRRDGEADVLVASDFLPEDWPAKANALFTLAALVEIGLAPPEACPPDVARDPRAWARVAIEASAEMGSPEARLSMADRALRRAGRTETGSRRTKTRRVARRRWRGFVPRRMTPRRTRRRPASFTFPARPLVFATATATRVGRRTREAEDGWAQVAMEEDLAARGVPEAQRHVGYRRLVGRGMARDEIAAARAFADAAASGDAAAAFNLGYMHMRGVGVPLDYARAGELFRRAADANLPAAHNGVGVLRYNGWGTPRDAAARARVRRAAPPPGTRTRRSISARYTSRAWARREISRARSNCSRWRARRGTGARRTRSRRRTWTARGRARLRRGGAIVLDVSRGTTRVGGDAGTRRARPGRNLRGGRGRGRGEGERRVGGFGGPGRVDRRRRTRRRRLGRARNPPRNPPRLPPDPWRALATFAALAESGSESAASNAAHMLRRDGAARTFAVDPDDAAARLFRRAARAGNAEAHVDLGDMAWDAVRAAGRTRPHVHLPDEEEEEGSDEREEKRARVPGTSGPGDSGAGARAGESRDHPDPSSGVVPSYTAVAPPPGTSPEATVAFHYRAAANAGFVEGAVSLAWARVHGVGVPRDLRAAARILRGAARDSQDDIEAVVPALAYAGVGALRVAERFARMAGFERALERQWRWPALVDGEKTERRIDATDRSNAVLDGGGGTTRHTGTDRSRRRATGNVSSGARRAPMEDALLTLLMCGAAAVGMARAAVGRRRDGGVGEPGGGEDRGGVGESRDARRIRRRGRRETPRGRRRRRPRRRPRRRRGGGRVGRRA